MNRRDFLSWSGLCGAFASLFRATPITACPLVSMRRLTPEQRAEIIAEWNRLYRSPEYRPAIIIQSRLHEQDLCGTLLDNDGASLLRLPTTYEAERRR